MHLYGLPRQAIACSGSNQRWALFEITGKTSEIDRNAALEAVELGLERTLDHDVAYGLRLLVDIAERSLSGGGPFLDPTTAVQAIDRLHDCLRQLASRPFPDGRYRDQKGKVRLVMGWRVRHRRVPKPPPGHRKRHFSTSLFAAIWALELSR